MADASDQPIPAEVFREGERIRHKGRTGIICEFHHLVEKGVYRQLAAVNFDDGRHEGVPSDELEKIEAGG